MNNSAEDSDDTNRVGEKGKPMLIQGATKKKRFLKEMSDFVTLKMSALIKTKNHIFLTHFSENAHFT